VDLIRAIDAVRGVGDVARSLASPPDAPWLSDEASFFKHFGVEYPAYVEFLALLSPDQLDLYERTMQVNPEAAVLWVLAMEVR
jgi:hypothetical protein